jgi:hypothetical protein
MGKLDESSLSKNGYQNNQTVNLSDFKDTTLSTNRAQELEKLRKELNNKNPSPNNSYVNFSYNSNPKHTTPLKSKKDDFNNNSLLSSIRSNHLLKTATFPNNQHSSSALQNKSAQSLLWQIIKEFKNEEYQEMEQFVEKLFSKMENDKPKIPENTKYNEKKTQITTLQSQITNINKPNKEDIKKIQKTIHNIIEMIDIWRKDRSPSKKPNVRFNSFNKTHKKTQLQQITRYDNIEKVKERNQKWQEKRNKIKNKKTQNSLNNYNNETNRSY